MTPTEGGRSRSSPRARHEPAEHFEDLQGQTNAAHLGMWIFLAGEVLLFSGLFALYGGYRARFPRAFAEGAGHTTLWMGTTGTAVLLVSSFLVAWSIHAVREDRRNRASGLLTSAGGLGIAFLGLKLWEYSRHIADGLLPGPYLSHAELSGPGFEAFFTLYYLLTGAHALHVLGGISILLYLAWRVRRGAYDSVYHTPQELGGMYWHLVDIVWLFVWPFFYLMR